MHELEDQRWRLQNLYKCREEGTGKPIPLRLRDEQRLLMDHIATKPHVPIYVIKSRRLGISTFAGTVMDDFAVFRGGFRGVLIDQKQEDATKKMLEILRFGVDNLPPEILSRIAFDKRNDSEMRIRLKTEKESDNSAIFAITGNRGGDCSMLHLSEFGPISALDPDRAQEIRSGAYPSARKGIRLVETTWYGGKGGDLYEMIEPILSGNPNAEGEVYFFPWHADPMAVKISGELTEDIEEYFRSLTEKLSKNFTREQKLWYTAKKIEQGRNMNREYPSTLTEAMSVPVPGAIYADEMTQLREEKRMIVFKAETNLPAYAFWDIGVSDYGCIWLIQFSARDILLLDYVTNEGEGAAHYVKWIKEKEREYDISVRMNYLPHDAAQRAKGTGKPFTDDVISAGIPATQFRIVPRTPDIWVGINRLRAKLAHIFIHATNCTKETKTEQGNTLPSGVQCLDFYRKKVTIGQGGAMFEDPVHDIYSNGADALRTYAEADRQGMLEGSSGVAKESRSGAGISPKVLRGEGPQSYSVKIGGVNVIR